MQYWPSTMILHWVICEVSNIFEIIDSGDVGSEGSLQGTVRGNGMYVEEQYCTPGNRQLCDFVSIENLEFEAIPKYGNYWSDLVEQVSRDSIQSPASNIVGKEFFEI